MNFNTPVHKEDGSTEVAVDPAFFCTEAILNTAYLFTGECYVKLMMANEKEIVITFIPKQSEVNIEKLIPTFLNELIDHQLRVQIRRDTAEIEKTIVSEAFAPLDTKEA